jgi:hypothetical protein
METFVEKAWSVVVGAFVITALIFVLLLLLRMDSAPQPTTSYNTNAVTGGLTALGTHASTTAGVMGSAVTGSVESTLRAIGNIAMSVSRAVAMVSVTVFKIIGGVFVFTARCVGTVIVFMAKSVGNVIVFVGRSIGSGVGLVTDTPSVHAMITPSGKTELPVIQSYAPVSSTTPVATISTAASPAGSNWPIHGAITTLYGVPHRPFQPVHTGMDISSGQRSGVTPIKPFRAGVVIETIHSRYGLGNHVVLDHGNGLTSVYAHMYSIAVTVGQTVAPDTTLGQEGSTGLSTGPHVHFEIRQDGNTMNPQDYVPGHP